MEASREIKVFLSYMINFIICDNNANTENDFIAFF